MKKLILIAGLAIIANGANAEQYFQQYNDQRRMPQHYEYKDQYGLPQGSADWNGFDHSWEFKDQYGLPQGSSQYNEFNNSWEYKDQYGLPQGSAEGQ
jgi:hypothetical protein